MHLRKSLLKRFPISRNTAPAVLFFTVTLIIGWVILPDYGISWDEFLQRRYGLMAYDHVVRTFGLDWQLFYPDYFLESTAGRQYSIIFSLVAAAIERLLNIGPEDHYAQFQLRHKMTFLLFWLSTICFYKILKERFFYQKHADGNRSVYYPLLGTLLLLLTPRVFAHSFFNPKDIVLLSFYIISLYTLIRFLKKTTLITGFIHGIACAFVVNARTPGLIVPVLTVLFSMLYVIPKRQEVNRKAWVIFAGSGTVFVITFVIFAIAFFPYLWGNLQDRAVESFNLMSNFPKEIRTLMFGQYVGNTPPPFYYPYAWMGVTLPLLNVFLLVTGIIWFLRTLVRNLTKLRLWSGFGEFTDLIFFSFFAGPLLAVWFFQSTLYDGWRHLYFVYPPILILGLVFLNRLLTDKRKWIRQAALGVTILSCLHTSVKMIKIHPHQQVYFNELAGDNKMERFEMDYWGVAYKQAFEEIVRRDTTGQPIHVYCANQPCFDNYFALPEPLQSKIKMRYGIEVATYYLSNHRWEHTMRNFLNKEYPFDDEYFSIKADGERIIGVYRVGR